MSQVRLREKGQVTIPAELLQEWNQKNHVTTNDQLEATLNNGVLMLIPSRRQAKKRDIMSFAGIGKGLWGDSPQAIDSHVQELRGSWTR